MINAIVLAAGLSTRMGRPKLILPWGATTVIGQVVSVLAEAGVETTIVVTGGTRAEVESVLAGQAVRFAYNPQYADGEMIHSLHAGIARLDPTAQGFLLVLGDQPQIEANVVRQVMAAYQETRPALVVPSFQMRRGHPWLVGRALWPEILALRPPQTMRDFLNRHKAATTYVEVASSSILMDLDTPEDYARQAPKTSC